VFRRQPTQAARLLESALGELENDLRSTEFRDLLIVIADVADRAGLRSESALLGGAVKLRFGAEVARTDPLMAARLERFAPGAEALELRQLVGMAESVLAALKLSELVAG